MSIVTRAAVRCQLLVSQSGPSSFHLATDITATVQPVTSLMLLQDKGRHLSPTDNFSQGTPPAFFSSVEFQSDGSGLCDHFMLFPDRVLTLNLLKHVQTVAKETQQMEEPRVPPKHPQNSSRKNKRAQVLRTPLTNVEKKSLFPLSTNKRPRINESAAPNSRYCAHNMYCSSKQAMTAYPSRTTGFPNLVCQGAANQRLDLLVWPKL